jgi:thiamine pyrophosphate-dependent acetolactate synthase large subunit-like protein
MIEAAKRPIIIGGDGVVRSGAQEETRRLGDTIGALLATTLRAKGLFDGHPFHIGIAGGYATDLSRKLFSEADLLIGVGAGLGHWTTDAGKLYPKARTIAIDTEPRGLWEGVRVADLHIHADAKVAIAALLAAMPTGTSGTRTGMRTNTIADAIASDLPDPRVIPIEAGVLDPRAALLEIDQAVPKDFDVVLGNAHFTFIAMSHLSGRAAERYFTINDFGAIGHALPAAAGVAAARNDGRVMLIEGDGSLLMTIQDLETIARQDLKLLICVVNDGGYGAEIHRLRPKGVNAGHTIFGRPHFAAMARAVGLRGETINSLGDFDRLYQEHVQSGRTTLWDVHVSNKIPARTFRRLYYGED